MSQLLNDLRAYFLYKHGYVRSLRPRTGREKGHRLIRGLHKLYETSGYPPPTKLKALKLRNVRPERIRWSVTYEFVPHKTSYWLGQLTTGELFHFAITPALRKRLQAGIPVG